MTSACSGPTPQPDPTPKPQPTPQPDPIKKSVRDKLKNSDLLKADLRNAQKKLKENVSRGFR